VDYNETYSPVARAESYRIFHTITGLRHMHVRRMDAVSSFLNGNIDADVYTRQPIWAKTSSPNLVPGRQRCHTQNGFSTKRCRSLSIL
jgi:hypothetical protein